VFDAAHIAAQPVADRTTAHLDPDERALLIDLLTRFTYPPEPVDK
jgi:hypothetical protein